MHLEETIPLFAVARFYFETVKMYPEKEHLCLFPDCSVHWLVEGQHQACSSAPGARLSRCSLIAQLSSGAEKLHSRQLCNDSDWGVGVLAVTCSWLFPASCLISLTAVWSRESCTPTSSSAILDLSYC